MTGEASVDFRVHPDQYRHWRLACAGPVATLTCTAVTLYSGQLVAQSEKSVVMTFACVSG